MGLEQRAAAARPSPLRGEDLLLQAAMIASEAETASEAIRATLTLVCDYLGCPLGHAYLRRHDAHFIPTNIWHEAAARNFDRLKRTVRETAVTLGQGLLGEVAASGQPRWQTVAPSHPAFAGDGAGEHGLCGVAAFPIAADDGLVGILEVYLDRPVELQPPILEVMAKVGDQVGRVIERRLLEKQVADLAEHERRRIGQELHDSLGQQVTGAAMLAKSLQRSLEHAGRPESDAAAQLAEVIREAQVQVRALAKGLIPVEVGADGLPSALDEMAASLQTVHSVDCSFEGQRSLSLEDKLTATHLFQIAQEALHNAVRHGRSSRIRVGLEENDGAVTLTVSDDGVGLPADRSPGSGMGLRIMRYRASVIGGKLHIESAQGQGTTIRCSVPVD